MGVQPVKILDANRRSFVPAELENDLPADTLFDVEDQWDGTRRSIRNALRSAAVPRVAWPESLHWDWGRKSLELAADDAADARVMAVRRQGWWEAAMVTFRRDGLTTRTDGAGHWLVYVEYVEVAPWNWSIESIGQTRRYSSVGSLLIQAAVGQSVAEGFGGRVGLHAIPQAEAFYRGQGFTFVRRDADKQNLAYYERPAQWLDRR